MPRAFGWTVGQPASTGAPQEPARRGGDPARRHLRRQPDPRRRRIVPERAVIEDPHTVRLLKSGRTVRAERILVAVGAHPVKEPAVPGIDLAITSNEVFELESLPERILVIGGGYIRGGIRRHLRGARQPHDAAAPGRKAAARLRRRDPRRPRRGLRPTDGPAARAHAAAHRTAGRRPLRGARRRQRDPGRSGAHRHRPAANVDGLGLDRVGIETDGVGAIPVDAYSQTKVPSIYAVGDVTNRANLTPVAIREGHAFADTVYGGRPSCVDHRLIPPRCSRPPRSASSATTRRPPGRSTARSTSTRRASAR